jgi:hypothetical protein
VLILSGINLLLAFIMICIPTVPFPLDQLTIEPSSLRALDRVFISQAFETLFRLCSLAAETSLSSDHTPLVFNYGDESPTHPARFFFETSWFKRQEFLPLVQGNWDGLQNLVGGRNIVDWWIHMSSVYDNISGDGVVILGRRAPREDRALGLDCQLDILADASDLHEESCALRYHLEADLLQIYIQEEEY